MYRFFVKNSSLKINIHEDLAPGEDLEILTPRGGKYLSQHTIGRGSLDQAYVYKDAERDREFVVLRPVYTNVVDNCSVMRKFDFFDKMYGQESLQFVYSKIKPEFGYRFILPRIPGVLLNDLVYKDLESFKDLKSFFIKTLEALLRCHQNGLVYIDFNFGNLICDLDPKTGCWSKCDLIDGGLSSPIGQPVSAVFKCNSNEQRLNKIRSFYHIAPECWYLSDPPVSSPAMDVYSFYLVVSCVLKRRNIHLPMVLKQILKPCYAANPADRPTINMLLQQIDELSPNIFVNSPANCVIS